MSRCGSAVSSVSKSNKSLCNNSFCISDLYFLQEFSLIGNSREILEEFQESLQPSDETLTPVSLSESSNTNQETKSSGRFRCQNLAQSQTNRLAPNSIPDAFFYQELSRVAGEQAAKEWLFSQSNGQRLSLQYYHASGPSSPLPSSGDSSATTADRSSFSSPGCSPLCSRPIADSSPLLQYDSSPAPRSADPPAGSAAAAAVDFRQRRQRWLREPPPSIGSVQRRCLSSSSFRAALSDRLPAGELGLLFTDAAHAVLTESFLDRASFPAR